MQLWVRMNERTNFSFLEHKKKIVVAFPSAGCVSEEQNNSFSAFVHKFLPQCHSLWMPQNILSWTQIHLSQTACLHFGHLTGASSSACRSQDMLLLVILDGVCIYFDSYFSTTVLFILFFDNFWSLEIGRNPFTGGFVFAGLIFGLQMPLVLSYLRLAGRSPNDVRNKIRYNILLLIQIFIYMYLFNFNLIGWGSEVWLVRCAASSAARRD